MGQIRNQVVPPCALKETTRPFIHTGTLQTGKKIATFLPALEQTVYYLWASAFSSTKWEKEKATSQGCCNN